MTPLGLRCDLPFGQARPSTSVTGRFYMSGKQEPPRQRVTVRNPNQVLGIIATVPALRPCISPGVTVPCTQNFAKTLKLFMLG